ncbi:restriction endonuclease [Sorangium sp. So ce1128]
MALAEAKNALVLKTAQAIKNLHWKDFELLVDLVFRQSGWRRVSAVGTTMKSVDIELEDPIAGDRYQVQIKSRATMEIASKCKEEFSASSFRKYYFVVHTPDHELLGAKDLDDDGFEVILPERLARMVVDGGLTGWLRDKIL